MKKLSDLNRKAWCVIADGLEQIATDLKALVKADLGAPISHLAKYKNILESFPEDLRQQLNFTEQTDHVIVKPRQFLGSENFAKIATIVRELKGEYISAGKESHFKIPK